MGSVTYSTTSARRRPATVVRRCPGATHHHRDGCGRRRDRRAPGGAPGRTSSSSPAAGSWRRCAPEGSRSRRPPAPCACTRRPPRDRRTSSCVPTTCWSWPSRARTPPPRSPPGRTAPWPVAGRPPSGSPSSARRTAWTTSGRRCAGSPRVVAMCVWLPATYLEPGRVSAGGTPVPGVLTRRPGRPRAVDPDLAHRVRAGPRRRRPPRARDRRRHGVEVPRSCCPTWRTPSRRSAAPRATTPPRELAAPGRRRGPRGPAGRRDRRARRGRARRRTRRLHHEPPARAGAHAAGRRGSRWSAAPGRSRPTTSTARSCSWAGCTAYRPR